MIPIDQHNSFVVYFIFCFVALIVLWARELWRTKVNDWELSKDHFYICDRCHLVFPVRPHMNITRCPRCNEMCILKTRRTIF